jgi:hypothetical protein
MYDAKSANEIMGRYYKLWERGYWDDERDPDEIIAELLKISRQQIPQSLDLDGELLDLDGDEISD